MRISKLLVWTLALALVPVGALGCENDTASGSTELVCDDGLDNDSDGDTDCADSDCAADPFCQAETICNDGADNDADGDTDCADSDCATDPVCLPETDCADGVDNDSDGDTDCDDSDCAQDPVCSPATETACDDGVDNDSDGDTDCDDSDCAQNPACNPATETLCNDGVDNDNDGDTDCDDSDCEQVLVCNPTTETACADGVDNDSDGDTDCDDSDCAADPFCLPETDCDDDVDNDGDGDTDCDDSDCANDPVCSPTTETDCGNGLDDDGDGDIDCADSDCVGDPGCTGAGDTCMEILACSQSCPDIPCIDACKANGCPSGTAAFQLVQNCLMTNCLVDCMSDPSSPACLACLATNCSGELADCAANTCEAIGETNCTDGIDNDNDGDTDCADSDCVAEPVCGGGGQTCGEVLTCAQACSGDAGCITACRDNGCQTAQTAFDDVMACMMGNCLADCLIDPASAACTACLALNCTTEIATCMSNQCQTGGEIDCGNGVDDDNDGDTDCADSDCAADPLCSAATEIVCDDGVDNDNDGDTDCDDSDCTGNPACGGTGWDCGQIMTCSESCGTDMTCVNNCRDSGCTTAQTSFDAVLNCMIASCLADCAANPQSVACDTCMTNNCSAETTACNANTCP